MVPKHARSDPITATSVRHLDEALSPDRESGKNVKSRGDQHAYIWPYT